MKSLFIFFCLMALVPSGIHEAYAKKEGHIKWWKNPKIVKELDLSSAQVERIEDIFSSYKGRIVTLNSELDKKEKELRKVVKNPNSTKEEVLELSDEVGRTKGELRRLEVNMFLEIRDVLTPAQREKLQTIKARYR